jgi:hypothetical protein
VPLEWASLDHLGATAPGVAPRLLGGDGEHGLVVLEALPDVRSLDESLLSGDPAQARDDVLAWSRALARLHAGTRGTADGFGAARARRGLSPQREPWWLERLAAAAPGLTAEARDLGVDPEAVGADLDRICTIIATSHVALVHGDPLSRQRADQHGRVPAGRSRAGEHGVGGPRLRLRAGALPELLVLRPTPRRPGGGRPSAAYEDAVTAAGVVLGDEWAEAVVAALALFAAVRRG